MASPDLTGIGYLDLVDPSRSEARAGSALPVTVGRLFCLAHPCGEANRLTGPRRAGRTRLATQCPRVLGQSGRKQRVGEPERNLGVAHPLPVAGHPRAEHRIRADLPPLERLGERTRLRGPHRGPAPVQLLRVLRSLAPESGDTPPVEEI